MVEVDLLDFLRKYKQLAKQALETDAGKPVESGLARWKHLVIHGYRLEDGHSCRETENRFGVSANCVRSSSLISTMFRTTLRSTNRSIDSI